jgi:hypothetical protein
MDPREEVSRSDSPATPADASTLRVIGAHIIDRYLVVEWYSRRSEVNCYRHLWWLGLS